MKFCNECNNLYFPGYVDNQLLYVCHKCGNKEEKKDMVISYKQFGTSFNQDSRYKHYLKYDPASPRTIHYTCPHRDCPTHDNPELKEAIIENEGKSLVNVYICTVCNSEWRYTK